MWPSLLGLQVTHKQILKRCFVKAVELAFYRQETGKKDIQYINYYLALRNQKQQVVQANPNTSQCGESQTSQFNSI